MRDDRLQALERGRLAERAVADALEADGWLVVARNWSGGGGELDLVAERDDAIRFVEVKARAPGDDSGDEAVGRGKRRHLTSAAEAWLLGQATPRECAFTVVVVEVEGATARIVAWYDDAFDAE